MARLVLALEVIPPEWLGWIKSPSLACIVADPVFTFRHVREASAVRSLMYSSSGATAGRSSQFNRAYQLRGTIRLPPLLLALLEGLLSTLPGSCHPQFQHVALGLVLLFIDLLVAILLEDIARRLLLGNGRNQFHPSPDDWEQSLESRMPKAIQAPLKHIVFRPSEEAMRDQVDNGSGENSVAAATGSQQQSANAKQQSPLVPLYTIPSLLATLYFASPATILSGAVYECFRNLPLLVLLGAIDAAALISRQSSYHTAGARLSPGDEGLPGIVLSSSLLALAAYMDLHYVLFVIPVALFLRGTGTNSRQQLLVASFGLYFVSLHLLSFLLIGADLYPSVIASAHLNTFRISNMEPSLSVLWYFGMELFGRFHRYFAILLGGLPYILVAPLTIRLWRYPEVLVRSFRRLGRLPIKKSVLGTHVTANLFALLSFLLCMLRQVAVFWMLGVLYRPPSTLYQYVVGLCLMSLCPRSCVRMRTAITLVALCAVPVPAILFVVMHWLWLVPGTGEANFLFFQALAYNAFVGLIAIEFTGASLRRDKALRLTEKHLILQEKL
jgi:hypothetical protein